MRERERKILRVREIEREKDSKSEWVRMRVGVSE